MAIKDIYRLAFKDETGTTFEKEFLVKVIDANVLNYEKDLLLRNIVVYSSIFGSVAYIVTKRKKIIV